MKLNKQRKWLWRDVWGVLCCLVGVGVVWLGVAWGWWAEFDAAFLLAVHSGSNPGLDQVMVVVTELGNEIGMMVSVGLIMSFLWFGGKYLQTLFILASVGGAAMLNYAIKVLVMRPRPMLWPHTVVEASYSFPSAHAMMTAALAAAVVSLAWTSRWRWWVVGGAVVYVGAVSFSRLYLGVHFPSDIVAGWLLGVAWVIVVARLVNGAVSWRKPSD